MKELSENQIDRQDFVDNQIYNLIISLVPTRQEIDWNIEMIADVREAARHWIVERLNLSDEMTFYPFFDQ